MPYTYKSLTLVWLLISGLYALTGSGVVAGSWVLLLVVAALGVPLILTLRGKPRTAVGAITTSHERALVVSTVRGRSSLESGGVDVYRWENEGGARRTHFSGGVPAPVRVAP